LDGALVTIEAQIASLEVEATQQLAELHTTFARHVNVMEVNSLSEADSMATDIELALDHAAVETVAGSLSTEGEAPSEEETSRREFTLSEDPGTEIAVEGVSALESLANGFDQQLIDLHGNVADGLDAIVQRIGEGCSGALNAVRTSAAEIEGQSATALSSSVEAVRQNASQLANQAIESFRQPVERTISQFDADVSRGESEIVDGVNQVLAKDRSAANQVSSAADRAAQEAAAAYDRPTWLKVIISIGKAVLFLAAAIILTFVLAAVIFAVGLLLVKAGIIAGITFAAALVIAVVVVAIGFVVWEIIARTSAYLEEHGPIDNFWEALGVATGIVLLSVLSLTGIPQVIEGIRGKRFFSERPLSGQERSDLIVGGALQFLLLVFARFVGRGSRAGGGRGGRRPGVLERIGRRIEQTLERWILGKEKLIGCFVAETVVLTPGGPVCIERLRVGDEVLSNDPDNETDGIGIVQSLFKRSRAPIIELDIGGTRIRCTEEHPFWVRGAGWIEAGHLRPGEELVS
jgi:uncharacterized membrane protein